MQDSQQIEIWRRMAPAERWKFTAELLEDAWRVLSALDPAERERRLEIARRNHRLSNEAIVRALQ